MATEETCPKCGCPARGVEIPRVGFNRFKCAGCGAILASVRAENALRLDISVLVATPVLVVGFMMDFGGGTVFGVALLVSLLVFHAGRRPLQANKHWRVVGGGG